MQRGSNLTNTSCAQSVTEIEELVLQILHRLPLTALGKFKSVSKRWRFLISTLCSQNPRPVRALLLQYRTGDRRYSPYLDLLPLHTASTEPERHVSLRFDDGRRFQCLRSCNGLLLCGRCLRSGHSDRVVKTDYFVYNPLTRQLANLPSLDHDHVIASLAYEPSKSPHYKVVCLCETLNFVQNRLVRVHKIMIYSSETCRWDDSSFEPGLRVLGSYTDAFTVNSGVNSGVYWNDLVYYISHEAESKLYRFDVEKEVMSVGTALPSCRRFKELKTLSSIRWRMYFMVRGRMYFMVGTGSKLKVYEMMNGDSEWRVKYEYNNTFDRNDVRPFYYESPYQVFFPTGDENGEDELWVAMRTSMAVLRCNLRSGSVNVVKVPQVVHCIDDHVIIRQDMTAHDLVHSILDIPRAHSRTKNVIGSRALS